MRLLLCILVSLILANVIVCVTVDDRATLVNFYNALGGQYWTRKNNWLVGDPCTNNWYGLSCIGSNVDGINMQANNLTGTIPADFNILSVRDM